MMLKTLLRAGLFGLGMAAVTALPAAADVLRIQNGGPATALNVPMNRAVIVESDQPFAELSIANPGIADISTLSDRAIYVLGKTPGRTTLTILSADARLIANVEVHVTPDIAEFRERLRQILPGEQIEVRTANDGIVLSGMASSTGNMERALELANRYAPDRVSNMMTVGGSHQVMLKVRFAEMSRSVSKGLGGSLGGSLRSGLTTGTQLPERSFLGDREGALRLTLGGGSLEFSVLLEALEQRGLVRTLAEPNLVALSGQEAKFLAGGEYPIPVQDDDTITVEYKPFGVELNFTPWVVESGQINLAINAAVSGIDPTIQVSSGTFSINAFRRRETSTTVELRDGESFAIAGLLQDDFRNQASQVPWLGDIPILGALFRSQEFRRDQSELVIIVTAHLVSPVRGEALALPTDRVRLPSERDMFLFGRTQGMPQTGAAGEVARQGFSGAFGYVMD